MTEPVLFSVAQTGSFPATRLQARDTRDRLEDALLVRDQVDLTIDFTGVDAMTISFADEFLGKFLSNLESGSKRITVKATGLNLENSEAVAICLERRGSVLAVLNADGTLSLVGDSIARETFQSALKLEEFSANDLAEVLRISPQNANNRLKRLVEAGALRKVKDTRGARGGKHFRYTVVAAEVPGTSSLSA